jgi:hypothetical protein
MGRRAHIPEPAGRRQVEAMSAYGVPEADIARVLGIDPKTLRKHYRDELDTGSIKANSRMAENLYRKAMGDGPQAVTATIFWLKTRAKWRETPATEDAAREGGPVTVIVRKFFEPVYEDGKLIGPAEVAPRNFPMIEGRKAD